MRPHIVRTFMVLTLVGYALLGGIGLGEYHTANKLRDEQTTLAAQTQQLAAAQSALHAQQEKTCDLSQNQWRGLLTYTRFLGHEFHATPSQIRQGIDDLKTVIGHHPPKC